MQQENEINVIQIEKLKLLLFLDNLANYVTNPSYKIAAAAAESLQSCPTLCDPIDGNPAGSPVPGILQARTLEWIAISFSNTESRLIIFFAVEDGEALYSEQK